MCAQIDSGSLERDVVVRLSTVTITGGTAAGKCYSIYRYMTFIQWLLYTSPANSDYSPVSSLELTFTSGQSFNNTPVQCTELIVFNDDILEDTETFSVRLSSESDQVIITAGREEANVTIREDDTDCK